MANETKDVVKSNALVEARYRPKSLNQMRLLLAALTQIRSSDAVDDNTDFVVTAGALSAMTGNNMEASYKALKRAADELMVLHIGIDILPNGREGRPRKRKINVVSQCEYQKDEGRVVLNFTNHIIPYISELSSHFTAYKTKVLMNLKSAYGIRLYELCRQWIPFGNEREFEVDEFREIFQIENRHTKVFDLKRYVVLPAIRDVNKNTDLKIEFRQVKNGRVITHFQFVITKKPPPKQTTQRPLVKQGKVFDHIMPHPAVLAEMAKRKED